MPNLSTLSEALRNQLLTTAVEMNAATPFCSLAKSLSASRIAVVTSAGLHLREDVPFVQADPSYRIIPSDVASERLLQSHGSLHFDRSAMLQDINVVLPIDRLREMRDAGAIGAVAPTFYSFLGAQRDVSVIKTKTAREVAQLLIADGVDVVLLTPTCPGCTQTVSVIARVFEEEGLRTVAIVTVREHAVKVKPPRALYVPFPFGLTLGHPNNREEQWAVLDAAFSMLDAERGPVLVDFADAGGEEMGGSLQSSDVALEGAAASQDFATEVTLMRRYWEQRVATTGRTNVGLSKVPPHRFRGVVRFLEEYAASDRADSADRPADMDVLAFLQYCIADLRAIYLEARMQTHPDETSADRQRWILANTALSAFLRRLGAKMLASHNPKMHAAVRSVNL